MVNKVEAMVNGMIKERLEGFKPEQQAAVFADFDKMVAHLARTHRLHQDEVALLMAIWFNSQPGCLKINITKSKEEE